MEADIDSNNGIWGERRMKLFLATIWIPTLLFLVVSAQVDNNKDLLKHNNELILKCIK